MPGFTDEAQAHVKAGDGGAGAVSFRREAHVARGGPDGGDGGDGGDIWFVADRNVSSLLGFRDHPHRRAADGSSGMGKGRHGRAGTDLVVGVPEGTVVKALGSGSVLADLGSEGARWLAAQGGRGGRGNARFLSNRMRAPAFAEQREPGDERWLDLELKLMADVALVGFPNAGKSTLISAVSAAKPKIADYPFTTLEPHLGVVRHAGHEMVMADIPGLIKGASEGRGLGHRFLRHIERARALVVLLDLSDSAGMGAAEQHEALLEELGDYSPELLERPRLVVGSKLDAAGRGGGSGAPLTEIDISAVTREGLDRLLGRLVQVVQEGRETRPAARTFALHSPSPDGVLIRRDGDGSWEVEGREARRAVALTDLDAPGALEYAERRLEQIGAYRALARAGAKEGDVVRIGGREFDYRRD